MNVAGVAVLIAALVAGTVPGVASTGAWDDAAPSRCEGAPAVDTARVRFPRSMVLAFAERQAVAPSRSAPHRLPRASFLTRARSGRSAAGVVRCAPAHAAKRKAASTARDEAKPVAGRSRHARSSPAVRAPADASSSSEPDAHAREPSPDASSSSEPDAHAREPSPDARVDVRILSKHRPVRLRLDGPRSFEAVASGNTLVVDGHPLPHALRLAAGNWRVRGRGLDRRYEASLSLAARDGELIVVATFALETYVAAVTASETEVDTPFEALRAQAITARSYVLASGKRHDEARACDLTHCQVLRGEGFARHLRRARDAARSTEGMVLRLPGGSIALAPFHASCGGHTAEPVAVFGAPDLTGAAAVPDKCPPSPWRAVVPRSLVSAAASEALGGPSQVEDLLLDRDSSGAVVRVVDRASGPAPGGIGSAARGSR